MKFANCKLPFITCVLTLMLSSFSLITVLAENPDRWQEVGREKDSIRYIDKETVRLNKDASKISYWTKYVFLSTGNYFLYQKNLDYKNKAVSDTAYGAYSSKGEGHLQEWKERGSVYHVILPDSMIEKEAAMACNILKVKNDIKSGGHNWKLIKVRSLDRSDAEMRNFPFLKRKVLKYHICTDYYLYDSNQKKYIAFVRMDDQSYPVFPQEKETTTSFVSKYYVDLEGERVAPVLPYWEICAPDSLEEAILNELKSMIGEKK